MFRHVHYPLLCIKDSFATIPTSDFTHRFGVSHITPEKRARGKLSMFSFS